MWRKLKNIFLSLKTYRTLSPNLQRRQSVNRFLRQRSALPQEQWYETFWRPLQISTSVIDFVYTHLPRYSGLDIARTCPSDRLEEDLYWTEVCWFDWDATLCDDIWKTFHVDIGDRLLGQTFVTVADLIICIDHEIAAEQILQESLATKTSSS
jgi:hypothetical protein